ncbi:MAG TPA: EscU/YscU/HrcU family type III secretion system export apparatus switch protein [Acidobacteriaceae bacterium]
MADANKTEQATPKRRKKAREQGQVARSRELPGVLALAAVLCVLMLLAPAALTHWTTLYRNTLSIAATSDLDGNGPMLFWPVVEVMRWLVPVLLAAMVVSLFAGLVQGGINIAPEVLAFKFERLNPAARLGQMFSPMGLSQLLKSLLPFAAIVWVVVTAMQSHWDAMVNASSFGLRAFPGFVGAMVFEVVWKSGLILLAWSLVDYALTWKKMEGDLKMSKQDLREESKETDGNPVIRSRVRQLQRAMRRARSLKAAATATVVVTNPTHYAIALRYETDMAAPVVVAKGRDLLAEKIKQIARDADIMLIENKPLAQALYKSVEVGDCIPSKLYQAVAEILVMVFRAQAEVRQSDAERRSRDASGKKTAAPASSTPKNGGAR